MLGAALISAVFWMVFAWYMRIPCSSTHALIGGLVGAVLIGLGPSGIHSSGLLKMILSLTLTATFGIIGGYVIARLCYKVTQAVSPRANNLFNRGQLVTAVFLGFAVGSTNAQNAMGITTLCLLVVGAITKFEVPHWVVISSAVCLALGNLIGGTRLIKTMGGQFFQVRPLHGFSAEVSSTLIILGSSVLGGNVSTTHVTNMSIIGAGSAEGVSMVRWSFVQRVLLTWLLTIPATALIAGGIYLLINTLPH
jgi:PiT family inorganic phosphate transporter